MLTLLQLNDRPLKPAVFDLVAGDTLEESTRTTDGTRILYDTFTGTAEAGMGEPTTIRFHDLADDGQRVVRDLAPARLRRGRPPSSASTRGPSSTHPAEHRRPTADGYRRIGERFHAIAFKRSGPSDADSRHVKTPKSPSSVLQALIFDFDGLIIDSERVEADCIIEIVADWGHSMYYADFGHLFGSVDADDQWDELLAATCGRSH